VQIAELGRLRAFQFVLIIVFDPKMNQNRVVVSLKQQDIVDKFVNQHQHSEKLM